MNRAHIATVNYIAAIYLTETGGTDQPDEWTELTPLCIARAWIDCRNFLAAIEGFQGVADLDPGQIGHDIWLTRNGFDVGFRSSEIYGDELGDLLTRLTQAIGGHDAEFTEPTTA